MNIRPIQFMLISGILIAIIALNIWALNLAFIGLIFGFGYIYTMGTVLGSLSPFKGLKTALGILLVIGYMSFAGAVIYFLHRLDNFSILFIIISIPAILYILTKNKNCIHVHWPFRHLNLSFRTCLPPAGRIRNPFLSIAYMAIAAICFYLLISSATTAAIRSPWHIISPLFLFLYFIATAILFLRRSLPLAVIHFFLSFSIALIIYSIGYGFDPFIHQATEKLIYLKGVVTPKPLYYLGQYSLVVILAKISQVSAEWIDKLLVPILSAIYLPIIIYHAYRDKIVPILFLSIPFLAFIATTPQSLANFFTVVIIFLVFAGSKDNSRERWPILLLTLTTIAVHPLAGLPVFFFALLSLLKNKLFFWTTFIISSISLPLVLFVNSKISNISSISFQLPKLSGLAEGFPKIFIIPHQFNAVLDLLYLYAFNWKTIFIVLAAIGYYLLRKKNRPSGIYPLISLSLLFNYLLLKYFIVFSDVIYYEQTNYAERMITLIFYFLAPLSLYAVYAFFRNRSHVFFTLLGSVIITSSLYVSYPRDDNYELDRGYNVSQSDINAAREIETISDGKEYIVLANQSVSAAALREFGFKKYFKTSSGEIFYYPIPTGGKLYQFYLDMVYKKPAKETMLKAMDLAGVDQGYFILNKYWYGSDRIFEYAKAEADRWKEIDNGEIYIFKYTK